MKQQQRCVDQGPGLAAGVLALRGPRPRGFTMVEIVIAMTIIAIAFVVSVPAIRSIKNEQAMREPIVELARLAKEARLRAMKEKRPYQVAFYPGGFVASRYFSPYVQLAELTAYLEEGESGVMRLNPNADDNDADLDAGAGEQPKTDQAVAPRAPKLDDHWQKRYNLPENTQYAIKFWHDLEETPVSGEVVKLWVFQPTGICQPLKVRLEREGASFDVEFNALTADIVKEVANVQ
ncbi:MAG TPA: type II secretion system protein [Prosthecobacter sp.]|nr:type II secretion system protein [Prosthecobacter sp.]